MELIKAVRESPGRPLPPLVSLDKDCNTAAAAVCNCVYTSSISHHPSRANMSSLDLPREARREAGIYDDVCSGAGIKRAPYFSRPPPSSSQGSGLA